MNIITQQVIEKLGGHVINQARYIHPMDMYEELTDMMYVVADTMTDDGTYEYLRGKPILDNANLVALAEKIGVEDIYDEDGWVDGVADYIIQNKEDCIVLWNTLVSKC